MPIVKKHFSLSPLNDNPLSIGNQAVPVLTNGFSHRDGFPTVKFSIPPQPAMLETSSLRLVGQFIVKQNATNTPMTDTTDNAQATANRTYPSGRAGEGGRINNNNTNANGGTIAPTMLNLSNFGGVSNVIDKVVIQSKKSLVELTSAINYSQYVAIQEVYTNNDDDYRCSPFTNTLSTGREGDKVNRLLNILPVPRYSANNSNSNKYVGNCFSINLNVDLMNIGNLFLDDDYLGGLLITLHLSPDSQVFCNRFNRGTAPNNDQSANSYVLRNLKLEGRYVIPTSQEAQSYPSVVPLQSRLNLINDIHSSTNSNSYTPQLQMVKGILNQFLDNDQTNSFTKNANNFRRIPAEQRNQVGKNGLRFPLNYAVELVPNALSPVENGETNANLTVAGLQFPVQRQNDCEVRHFYERALLDGKVPYHTIADLELTNDSMVEDYDTRNVANTGVGNNLKADCVGIGTDYTLNLGIMANMVNQDYNLTILSGVNTGNANAGANRNGVAVSQPLLQQTFIRHNGQFDTQRLIKVI